MLLLADKELTDNETSTHAETMKDISKNVPKGLTRKSHENEVSI